MGQTAPETCAAFRSPELFSARVQTLSSTRGTPPPPRMGPQESSLPSRAHLLWNEASFRLVL